ncbi:uncharacterized protein VDAG_04452 [Verticillium dahliae VdLs.17]|uniref:F-box domain-containing protein n=4 Tax=Verticillium TaxID=1036719 RepID=G2X2C8_VERDV|nr:uncharacterized protein VDAG_04452 [Verticillium dahliae VdLs.17]KAF3346170.1 Endoglucanase [Verticillium dahliae VDG2]KAH6700197.1 hypothetical protein EV126DRAFT_341366 [Verticillium dahliae]EGY23014.1 hypothetical protein VDAG_04452 [Verticillium dahliae VdLs.17]PNH75952.1 hypothetical protein VD0001_g1616 [Verticillium dahliae]RXG48020.1 hypothetical protein VDGE_04452 [Verticillium dahliae]
MDDGDPRYGDHEDSPETKDSAIFIMEEDEVTTIHWKPWPDIHGFTGFKLVTLTWELLENILLFVDEKTLLLAQRVNKYWRSVIQGSPSLRCRLFFEPSRPRTWANIHPNPLLGLVFHNWRVEVQHQMTHLRHTSRQMRSKVLASWHIIAIRWEGFQENHDHKTRGLTSSRPLPSQDTMDLWDPPWPDGPVGRKDASWRRMLACQPSSLPQLLHPHTEGLARNDPWKPLIRHWPLLTEFLGCDRGPWPAAQFTAMAPFLNAEYLAHNAARLLHGTDGRETVQLRLSWGPIEVRAPPVERDWFMFRPGAPAARMVSTGARSGGLVLHEGEDMVFSWLEGFVTEKMTYRVLDLASQMIWAVTYWQQGEYLVWRSAPMGPAKGTGLGRIVDGRSR